MNAIDSQIEKKKILWLYSILGVGIVLSFAPSLIAATLSMILLLGVLMFAYVFRSGSEDGSLMENHMTFIIRTIWISSFLAIATIAAASSYMFQMLDNMPLNPCIDKFLIVSQDLVVFDLTSFSAIFAKCMDSYWMANTRTFIISGIIAAGPVLFYFLLRFARGLARAKDGYRIANPRAWF